MPTMLTWLMFLPTVILFSNAAILPISNTHAKRLHNPEESIESEPMDGLDILENDILQPKNGRFRREVNGARRWPSPRIPYEIDPRAGFMSNETDMLLLAFKEFSDKTCVEFVPRTNERDYVFITTDPKRGCLSYIGWQGGRQEVYLLRPNCFYLKGTIMHELMHTIGFYHEHSRPDRDEQVQIVWENIRPDKMSNFQIEQTGNMLGAPYDYQSVMHYSALTFSKDADSKAYSMVPKDPTFPADRLGQRRGFSAIDLTQILVFYNCPRRGSSQSAVVDDLSSFHASLHQDTEDAQARSNQFGQLVRQARNQDPSVPFPSDEFTGQSSNAQFIVTNSGSIPLSNNINVDTPASWNSGSSSSVVSNSGAGLAAKIITDPVCGKNFVPDAVLTFLGFFYLFKDGLYWKYSFVADGVFKRQDNFPQAYKKNFNADIPDQLDSVFSYLTYIYFVKANNVWVAKSDTEIRGPVNLASLFPGLPDRSWDNIFVRGTSINFVAGSSTWLYDVKTDKLVGPAQDMQSPLFMKGPVAELSGGLLAAFPVFDYGGDGGKVYLLDRFTGQVVRDYPQWIFTAFC